MTVQITLFGGADELKSEVGEELAAELHWPRLDFEQLLRAAVIWGKRRGLGDSPSADAAHARLVGEVGCSRSGGYYRLAHERATITPQEFFSAETTAGVKVLGQLPAVRDQLRSRAANRFGGPGLIVVEAAGVAPLFESSELQFVLSRRPFASPLVPPTAIRIDTGSHPFRDILELIISELPSPVAA